MSVADGPTQHGGNIWELDKNNRPFNSLTDDVMVNRKISQGNDKFQSLRRDQFPFLIPKLFYFI